MTEQKLVCGWGINEADYVVAGSPKNTKCPFYDRWYSMLRRCTSEDYMDRNPSYYSIIVSDTWKYFLDFRGWMSKENWQGLHLDKDILVRGNKEYGPDTCAFVPQYINALLSATRNRKYLTGVHIRNDNGRFVASGFINGENVRLGNYIKETDAHRAWQESKIINIQQTIDMYKQDPAFREDVSKALEGRIKILEEDIANNRVTEAL